MTTRHAPCGQHGGAGWPRAIGALLAAVLLPSSAWAQCKLTESIRKVEGAERALITMENERILVEVIPELSGRIHRYQDKSRTDTPFEWLDDCPYHYGGRWEGKPFTYRIDARGPERAAITVTGGGKIAVALLRDLLGVHLAVPLDLNVERTMSIDPATTRLRVEVKITNAGEGVAPTFRYMVHAVFGQIPPLQGGRAFWFLPTSNRVEFFDPARGSLEMWASAGSGGAPLDHPFSRFTPGRKADKPRYEAAGWGAVLTSAGPTFIYYDPKQYDFIQYWFGGDAAWHFTFEPQSKQVDLKPGESTACWFALAYDSKDVPFNTPTVSYERPQVPELVVAGGSATIKARATTVLNKAEPVQVNFEVKDPKGQALWAAPVSGDAQPFVFTELSREVQLPLDSPMGAYMWRMTATDGKELASGKFEVVTAEENTKREMQKATAELRSKIDEQNRALNSRNQEFRMITEMWKDEANLALRLHDRSLWPEAAPPGVSVGYRQGAFPVLGLWKEKELPRIHALAPAPLLVWPPDAANWLGRLQEDRANLRDVAPDPAGKGLVALIVDRAKNRTGVIRIHSDGTVKRFGRFSDRPGEADDALGAGARALVVDTAGAIWVGTNAWGKTTVFKRGADGAPFEESVISDKGALKKFSPDGQLLGSVGLLEAPMDLVAAEADATAVILASYRSVSEYHGAQVREGVLIVRVADAIRIGEIKVPAGSVCVDERGRVWAADVAGHIACYSMKGLKLFDVASSPAPAVPEARLPAGSPVPVVLRSDGKSAVLALFTLGRKLVSLDSSGLPRDEGKPIPDSAGSLYWLSLTPSGPLIVTDKALWQP